MTSMTAEWSIGAWKSPSSNTGVCLSCIIVYPPILSGSYAYLIALNPQGHDSISHNCRVF